MSSVNFTNYRITSDSRNIYDNIFNNKNNNFGVTIHKINKKFDGKIVWNSNSYKKFISNQSYVRKNVPEGIDQRSQIKKNIIKRSKKIIVVAIKLAEF